MMRRHPLRLLSLSLALMWAVAANSQQLPYGGGAQPGGIRWQHDLEAAKALARQTNRLVLVHFWTPECMPCAALERNVFNQGGVGTALDPFFVPVKLNANENPATAEGLGITRVPTDVVLTPDGQVVGRLISPPTPGAYIAEVTQIAREHHTRSNPLTAGANATPSAAAPPLNAAYAGLQIAPTTPPALSAAPPTITAPSNPSTAAQPNGSAVSNPYASLQPAPNTSPAIDTAASPAANSVPSEPHRVAATPVAMQNQYAQPTTPPQATNSFPPQTSFAPPPLATTVGATSVPPANAFAGAPGTPYPNPAVPQPQLPITPVTSSEAGALVAPNAAATASAAATGGPDGSRLPAGAPPLGFDGYCPVSMRNHWKWVPGNPQFGVVHRGRTYWFVGQSEQQQFWTDPDRYAPALSGMDPVLAVDHQQQVPGKREHSIDYDSLFYMFSSEATLQQFTANPERYAISVRQAMGIPRGRLVR